MKMKRSPKGSVNKITKEKRRTLNFRPEVLQPEHTAKLEKWVGSWNRSADFNWFVNLRTWKVGTRGETSYLVIGHFTLSLRPIRGAS